MYRLNYFKIIQNKIFRESTLTAQSSVIASGGFSI